MCVYRTHYWIPLISSDQLFNSKKSSNLVPVPSGCQFTRQPNKVWWHIYIYINYKIGKQCVSLQSTVPCATRGVPTPPRVPCFSASPTSPACSVRMISEYLPSHNLVPVPFPVFYRSSERTDERTGSLEARFPKDRDRLVLLKKSGPQRVVVAGFPLHLCLVGIYCSIMFYLIGGLCISPTKGKTIEGPF